jgi:hypothetical protein
MKKQQKMAEWQRIKEEKQRAELEAEVSAVAPFLAVFLYIPTGYVTMDTLLRLLCTTGGSAVSGN